MALMSCGKDKATKLFRELDKDGIGLIERKKQGQGRPTKIYVKNFIRKEEVKTSENRTQSILIRIRLIGTILIHLSIRRRSLRRIDRLRRLMRWIRYGPIGRF